jgi:hypothetical protein
MPEGYAPIDDDEMDDMSSPFDAPSTAGSYHRMQAYHAPGGVHVVYRNGDTTVSVFEQPGAVEWSDLPAGGTRTTMDGDQAWAMPYPSRTGEVDVVVLARDGLVVTALGHAPHAEVVAIAEAVPDPPAPSLMDRVGQTCSWVAGSFGFPD